MKSQGRIRHAYEKDIDEAIKKAEEAGCNEIKLTVTTEIILKKKEGDWIETNDTGSVAGNE